MGTPIMGRADYFAPGDFNAACSMCGRKRKASQMVRNWQGLYRCPEHNEPRQPQDFARGVKDVMTVPWAQLEEDTLTPLCSPNGLSGLPDIGIPNCMIPDNTYYNPGGI